MKHVKAMQMKNGGVYETCKHRVNETSETISDSAECYAGLLIHFELSPACI